MVAHGTAPPSAAVSVNGAAFAAKYGAAPVPCSIGRRVAVRLNTEAIDTCRARWLLKTYNYVVRLVRVIRPDSYDRPRGVHLHLEYVLFLHRLEQHHTSRSF